MMRILLSRLLSLVLEHAGNASESAVPVAKRLVMQMEGRE